MSNASRVDVGLSEGGRRRIVDVGGVAVCVVAVVTGLTLVGLTLRSSSMSKRSGVG